MRRKLVINSAISLLYQLCSIIIGLLIPRLMLGAYGSEVNGMLTSIRQMLSIISLLDLGVGAVVQAALYKPLHEQDEKAVSMIYASAKRYFNIIAWVLILYVFVLCVYYGVFKTTESYTWLFTSSLILSLAISYFAQYYLGICNTLLLNADQRIYVVTITNLIGIIANAVCTVILIKAKMPIQSVQLCSSLLYLVRPLALQIYVKKNYHISVIQKPAKDALPDKWSGLAQHVAVTITTSVDTVILTIFSTFQMLSIYHVYVMPLNSIRTMIEVTSTSYKSYFGNIIAKGDRLELTKEFNTYETLMHYVVVIIFSTVIVTLVPFALIYSNVVSDANYKDELFGIMITLAYAMYSLRLPYSNIIFSAGKFRETQSYSIIECCLNIVISLALVKSMGLSGVALGTCVSSGYRMVMSAWYLKRDILYRSIFPFIKHIVVDCLSVVIIGSFFHSFPCRAMSFIEWAGYAAMVFAFSVVVVTILFIIFCRKTFDILSMMVAIKSKVRNRA